MPFAAFCDELKVFKSEEPFTHCSSVKVTEKPELYGNISWSGDAAWLTVTPSSDHLGVYKYENEQLLPHRFLNVSGVKSAIFLNWTNKDLVLGLDNGDIQCWNIREKSVSCVVDSGPKQPVNFLTCNLDDTCIASGSLYSNRIGVHSLKTNKYIRSLELPNGELTSCLRFCQCKKGYLAASTSASTVCVWDVVKSQIIFKPESVHEGACSGIEFSPINFSVLATVSLSQTLKMFDLRKKNRIFEVALNEPLHCVDIFQEGDKIAVGTGKGSVIIYDLRASMIHTTIKAYNNPVTALSIHKLEREYRQNSSEMGSADNPPPSNRTLDLSIMDLLSPIVRNGSARNVTRSSGGVTATPRAQNDSFLKSILSPRSFSTITLSPIDPCMPARQTQPQEISMSTPELNLQDTPRNKLSSAAEHASPILQQKTTTRGFRNQPNGLTRQSMNPSPIQEQAVGETTPTQTDRQHFDTCMESIITQLHNIREDQDKSFKLMQQQMLLLEEVTATQNNLTDILLNVIKPEADRGRFELMYQLVTQKNIHVDGFNMLAERTENIASMLNGLTQQVNALQNIITNYREP